MIRYRDIEINRKLRIIRRDNRAIRLRQRSFELTCALLLGGGMTSAEIFDQMYGYDPDGGPLFGSGIIATMICHLRKRFCKLGLLLCTGSKGGEKSYWLEPS